ncbi:hypothetical protein [Cytophaga hutchinsonii]|jgi:hypothetical protein|uniref:DUF4136 domain-containing protein n=1 Tax=Cytophaga hutchinsonii (strain ATCC 33406 / DSM 1761 / CIP 103989 / NBRC 15051 / NCIMB 9469 / D465) TaxID=269798 RepID=A0A6N4SVF0_CYTH3|nr:hypothetical protein [Cytophaga hutchinsonii]ABG60308.1 hypothetical protein CHU_3067 [Cytophaga hutchinsonii ATCC 33406]SFX99131.1 hypothetical protein SAMN04487930_11736 [Cytophaga hutchinsonii ATCC 33406]
MKQILVLASIALFLFTGCTSTTMQSSWKAPGATYNKEQFKKVMVVALFKDETSRRIAEDKIAAKNDAFHASYMTLGPDQQNMDEAAFTAFVKKEGYDGVLTLHLIDVEKSTSYVPGTYQGGYYGWYGMNYGGFYSPGYYTEDNNYIIETNVFSVSQNKLLWSGVTSTLNPVDMNKTIDEVWDAVIARMKREGFIIPTK